MKRRVKSGGTPPPQPHPEPKRVHSPLAVSFRHADPGGDFCLSTCDKDEVRQVVDALRRLTTMTWQQVQQSGGKGENKKGLGYTNYPDDALRVARPPAVSRDIPIAGFRASQRMRVFGFHIDYTFYVLWFDREHTIAP